MRSWPLRALLLAFVLALPFRAEAGRRAFTWAYDTETVPEGEVELEQWLWMVGRNPAASNVAARYWIWWGPVLGISDHFELALPFQVVSWAYPKGEETQLESFEADLRYRLKPRGDQDPLQGLIRLAYHQPTGSPEPPRIDADLVGSYDFESGLHLVLDVGAKFGLRPFTLEGGDLSTSMSYDLGVSYPVSDEVRVSAENFGEFPVSNLNGVRAHEFVGPAFEWTRGRFWLTFGVLIGLTPAFDQTPHVMPRLLWAVAL